MPSVHFTSLALFATIFWGKSVCALVVPFSGDDSAMYLVPSDRILQRDDYWYTQGVGAHKLHKRPVIWNTARQICEDEGGHLVIINSVAEANTVLSLFQNGTRGGPTQTYIFVGFHDLFISGHYVTMHSVPLAKAGYDEWAPGEPNGIGSVHCGSMHINGGFNDISCAGEYWFVCELLLTKLP